MCHRSVARSLCACMCVRLCMRVRVWMCVQWCRAIVICVCVFACVYVFNRFANILLKGCGVPAVCLSLNHWKRGPSLSDNHKLCQVDLKSIKWVTFNVWPSELISAQSQSAWHFLTLSPHHRLAPLETSVIMTWVVVSYSEWAMLTFCPLKSTRWQHRSTGWRLIFIEGTVSSQCKKRHASFMDILKFEGPYY